MNPFLGKAALLAISLLLSSAGAYQLQPLKKLPAPIPAPYRALEAYHFTAKESEFSERGELEVIIPKPVPSNTREYLTELYRYENGKYVKEQIEGEPKQFHFYVQRYWTEKRPPKGDYKTIYVITRVSIKDLKSGFKATGGFFNGTYGECPEGTMSSFGKCVPIK